LAQFSVTASFFVLTDITGRSLATV